MVRLVSQLMSEGMLLNMMTKYKAPPRGVVISAYLGLGDQIVCSPIYRHYASKFPVVLVPTRRYYQASIKNLLGDCPNILVQSYPDLIRHSGQALQRLVLSKFNFAHIELGRFAEGYLEQPGVLADENFYLQAGIPFDYRWSKFVFCRKIDREEALERKLGIRSKDYIFVHEDRSREMTIDRALLPRGVEVIEPNPSIPDAQVFDYLGVIERAREVHCIESSFSAMIESMDLKVSKFIHRYARKKVVDNPLNQFSYRSPWKIYG